MTGYTVHTGSTEKFSSGWDRIFTGGKKPAKKTAGAGTPKATKNGAGKPKKKK